MIRVARIQYDSTTGELIRPDDEWFLGAEARNISYIEDYNNGARVFEFDDYYSRQDVQNALEKLFNYKCCYCERVLNGGGFDVEHFRPKKAPIECVAPHPPHHGYFWLVYDWNNLYFSCVNCNETRRDLPGWDYDGTGQTAGKLNSFALFNPANRALDNTHNLGVEEPHLLDPCNDDPEEHITFNISGRALEKNGSLRGRETIRVTGLFRGRLNLFRQKKIHEAIEHLQEAYINRDTNVPLSKHAIRAYLKLAKDDSEFAGAVRSVIRDLAAFGMLNEFNQAPAFFKNIENQI